MNDEYVFVRDQGISIDSVLWKSWANDFNGPFESVPEMLYQIGATDSVLTTRYSFQAHNLDRKRIRDKLFNARMVVSCDLVRGLDLERCMQDVELPLKFRRAFTDALTRYDCMIENELKLCYGVFDISKDLFDVCMESPVMSPGAQLVKYFSRDFWVTQFCGGCSCPTAWHFLYDALAEIDAVDEMVRYDYELCAHFIREIQLCVVQTLLDLGEGLEDLIPLEMVYLHRRVCMRESYKEVKLSEVSYWKN